MPPADTPGSGSDDHRRRPPPANLDQRIREIAYLMWEAAGHQHGRALDYWLAAEREVLTTLAATAWALVGGREDEPPATAVAPPPADPAPPATEPAADPTAGADPDAAAGRR